MFNLINKHNGIWEWHDVLENTEEIHDMVKDKEWGNYTNKLPKKDQIEKYSPGSILGRSVQLWPEENAHKIILDGFFKCLENYNKENNLNLTLENIYQDSFTYREYLPGSFLPAHPDVYAYVKKDDVKVLPMFTIILYLNDNYEGGEINFIDDKLKITPKSGSGVMFPSQKVHEVLELKSGIRRMVQTYVHEHKRSYYDQDTMASKYWYNVIMNTKLPPCFYCPEESKYSEPELKTGVLIDVCEKHFHFKHMG